MCSSQPRKASGSCGLRATEIDIGRPDRSTMVRRVANSASTSKKSDTTCSTPVPVAPTPSAMPMSSAGARSKRWGVCPGRGLVVASTARAEPECSRLDPLACELGHRGDVGGCCVFVVGAALAHHVQPERPVGNLCCDVDVVRSGFDGVEELAERVPFPAQSFVEGCARDVLDALHQLDELVVCVVVHGGKSDAAVAHHRGGDPVPRRRLQPRIPGRLAVVVRVNVDDAGNDECSVWRRSCASRNLTRHRLRRSVRRALRCRRCALRCPCRRGQNHLVPQDRNQPFSQSREHVARERSQAAVHCTVRFNWK